MNIYTQRYVSLKFMDMRLYKTKYLQRVEWYMLLLCQPFIVMGIKASNGNGPVNFTFQMYDVVSIFELLTTDEEYDQIIHHIIKLGCF